MELTARNADLKDLSELLIEQHARKLDLVAPASAIEAKAGVLHIEGALDDDAWTSAPLDPEAEFTIPDALPAPVSGRFVPTVVADEGLAEKLNIPVGYLKRLRSERPDLFDANVNGWLHGGSWGANRNGEGLLDAAGDGRKFLVRAFRGDPGEPGIARAVLSDGYKIIDNLDVLSAALDGVREAGVNIAVEGCDLTERRMYVRIAAPEVRALAPALLNNYRNPFADPDVERARNHGWDYHRAREAAEREGLGFGEGGEPVVFAGFILSNSEVGGGAFTITPRLIVQVCRNGLTITRDAMRSVHLGGKLDEGVVRWSHDTQRKNLALVTAQARDAVATFLDVDYMTMVLTRMEEQAAVKVSEPAETVRLVGQRLKFSEARIAGILDHFVRGGQMSAGGVLNAVTSYAQTVPDADEAFDIEGQAVKALELAASVR